MLYNYDFNKPLTSNKTTPAFSSGKKRTECDPSCDFILKGRGGLVAKALVAVKLKIKKSHWLNKWLTSYQHGQKQLQHMLGSNFQLQH